jgi:hypothetical protein
MNRGPRFAGRLRSFTMMKTVWIPALAAFVGSAAANDTKYASASGPAQDTVAGAAVAEATVPDDGLVPASGSADGDDASKQAATKSDIEGLRTDLENYKYEQARLLERNLAQTTRGTTINGTVQARANAVTPDAKPGSAAVSGGTPVVAARSSSYDIPSASVSFAGSLYKDYNEGRNLDFRLQLAYARSNPASDNSILNLTDAYLRYSLLATNGQDVPVLNFTFGQQQLPFGLEAQTTEELRPVINNAQFLGSTGLSKRQVGIIVRGDLWPQVDYGFNYRAPILEYALGLVTGAGPNKSDDNDAKDFTGRAALTLPVDYNSWFRQLKVGASYYHGAKVVNQTVTTPAITASAATATQPAKAAVAAASVTTVGDEAGTSERWGADLYYNHAPFGVTYEYVFGKDAQPWTTSAAKPAQEQVTTSEGHVLTAFFTFGEQWFSSSKTKAKYNDFWPKSYQFFARYDRWNPNQSIPKNETTIYTGGFNWFFAQTTKLQLNFNYYRFQDPAKSAVKEYLGQFQFGF